MGGEGGREEEEEEEEEEVAKVGYFFGEWRERYAGCLIEVKYGKGEKGRRGEGRGGEGARITNDRRKWRKYKRNEMK